MKYLVEINDKTATGKSVLTMLKAFSEDEKTIKFINEDNDDTVSVNTYFKKLNSEITKSFRSKKK